MKLLAHIEEPAAPPPRRFALFDLGFRPFYLAASLFAALSIPLWALQFSGRLAQPYLAGPVWHAHEMVFGFTLAVIVGFLFTAGRNWTGQPTPTGWPLAALVVLWLLGRLMVLTPYAGAAAAVNVAFPLAAAVGLAVPFVKARNKRNYFFIGLLLLMAAANAVLHLCVMGALPIAYTAALRVALDVVLFIMAVMGGRVIPMFTNNAVARANAVRRPRVEQAALGSVLALLALDLIGVNGAVLAAAAVLAGTTHFVRWLLWKPWRTLRVPLVWILHFAYAWIPLHLLLRALAEMGVEAPTLATHALTTGAIGGLVIGMITRTARGHTARPLRADRFDVAAYVLVMLAAAVRVGLPALDPVQTTHAVGASASLWAAGFALYAVRYAPSLMRPRADGKPG